MRFSVCAMYLCSAKNTSHNCSVLHGLTINFISLETVYSLNIAIATERTIDESVCACFKIMIAR